MSKDMLGIVVRKLVTLPSETLGLVCDLLEKLHDPEWVVAFKRFLRKEISWGAPMLAISSVQEEWQEFYRKYLRLSVDFSEVHIPEEKEDFTRVLFIPAGLTVSMVIKAMQKHFKVWTYTNNLDQDVPTNDRNTKQSYAIRIRDRVEADEELKSLSANDLQEKNISCLTLPERLVYEFKYYSETNQHLDIQSWTLCAGSRHRFGTVPDVDWHGGKLQVNWYPPDFARGSLRGRAVVS